MGKNKERKYVGLKREEVKGEHNVSILIFINQNIPP